MSRLKHYSPPLPEAAYKVESNATTALQSAEGYLQNPNTLVMGFVTKTDRNLALFLTLVEVRSL